MHPYVYLFRNHKLYLYVLWFFIGFGDHFVFAQRGSPSVGDQRVEKYMWAKIGAFFRKITLNSLRNQTIAVDDLKSTMSERQLSQITLSWRTL